MKTKDPLQTAIARKLQLENVGCEELAGLYKGFRFYWNPVTGFARVHGQSQPAVQKEGQRELLAWVKFRA